MSWGESGQQKALLVLDKNFKQIDSIPIAIGPRYFTFQSSNARVPPEIRSGDRSTSFPFSILCLSVFFDSLLSCQFYLLFYALLPVTIHMPTMRFLYSIPKAVMAVTENWAQINVQIHYIPQISEWTSRYRFKINFKIQIKWQSSSFQSYNAAHKFCNYLESNSHISVLAAAGQCLYFYYIQHRKTGKSMPSACSIDYVVNKSCSRPVWIPQHLFWLETIMLDS